MMCDVDKLALNDNFGIDEYMNCDWLTSVCVMQDYVTYWLLRLNVTINDMINVQCLLTCKCL